MTDTSRSAVLAPGHPFLGFVNTVDDDGKTRRTNSFTDSAGLVAALRDSGFATKDIPAPQGQLAAILTLREAAYATLSAMAANRKPGREEGLHLEMAMKSALGDARFDFAAGGLILEPGPMGGLQDMLALSLMEFLRGDDLDRLRECRRCTHLFLDHGRGRGRRWCSMARCGNRAKAEAFRLRQRATGD